MNDYRLLHIKIIVGIIITSRGAGDSQQQAKGKSKRLRADFKDQEI
jgi:hypothetical protein